MRKLYRCLFALFCGIFFAAQLPAQQSGYRIRNYSPKEYGAFNQVWCAVQDASGVMYFGGSGCVISYNGQFWKKIPVKSSVAVRSILRDTLSDSIFVGAVGDFGFLQRSPDGQLKYVSIAAQLKGQQAVFADVWKIYRWKDAIVFHTNERMYFYRNGRISTIEPTSKDGFALAFLADKRLFVRQRGVGLMEVTGNTVRLLPGGEQFATVPMLEIVASGQGKYLLLTGDDGFYEMDERKSGSVFSEKPVAKDDFLAQSGVLGCEWLNDSLLCLLSRSGVAFYNRKLTFRYELNAKDGLADQSIASIMIDREHNLWLCTNNGITSVSLGSPDRYYSTVAGFDGVYNCVIRHKGELYVGTTSKLYRQSISSESDKLLFHPVNMDKIEVWGLHTVKDDLLTATANGLYLVKGDEVTQITKAYVNSISVYGDNELLLSEKGGLRYLRRDASGNWKEEHFYPFPSREFIDASELRIVPGKPAMREAWATTREKEICRIRFNIADSAVQLRTYVNNKNFICPYNLMPVYLNDSIYFWGSYMAMRYRPELDTGDSLLCFSLADDIAKMVSAGYKSKLMYPGNSRIFTNRPGHHEVNLLCPDEQGRMIGHTVLMSDAMGEDVINYISERNGIVWLCGTNALIRYNTHAASYKDIPFGALIASVSIGDSMLVSGCGIDQYVYPDPIPFRQNRFVFAYAAPFFDHEQETEFSFQLQGYDEAWSAWSKKTDIQYSNLHEGDYVFVVKARNIYGYESAVAKYSFTILPPWYRTGWAYLLYVVLFLVVVYLAVRISVNRLRKAKLKLERVVSDRTAEVVQQKQQIENQKSQLETALKDLNDSIHYAKRIQEAILPLDEQMSAAFSEMFVLLYPRDIVSGDFYWFAMRSDKLIVACVDCTGHGVPGALMSMIGNTLLNEIVMERGIESPGQILEQLHLRVRQSLKQDLNSETRDGMDISICVINNKTNLLQYAGANRPVFIIRKGELTELSPDKQSIGGYQAEEDRKFRQQDYPLENGDRIYMFSDGYPDQFGGEKGKKFMIKRFREMLLGIQHLPMAEQKAILGKTFGDWKSGHEQTDDVLVIGLKY